MAEAMMPKKTAVKDVLSREQKPKAAAPKADAKAATKKKHKHTHIEHHYDESGKETGHTVRHTPEGGGPEVSYAAPDMDAVHDGLEQHVGEPNAAAQPDAEQPQPQPAAAQPPMPGQGA